MTRSFRETVPRPSLEYSTTTYAQSSERQIRGGLLAIILLAANGFGSYAYSASQCTDFLARMDQLDRRIHVCENFSNGKVTQKQVCRACKPVFAAQRSVLQWINNNPRCFSWELGCRSSPSVKHDKA